MKRFCHVQFGLFYAARFTVSFYHLFHIFMLELWNYSIRITSFFFVQRDFFFSYSVRNTHLFKTSRVPFASRPNWYKCPLFNASSHKNTIYIYIFRISTEHTSLDCCWRTQDVFIPFIVITDIIINNGWNIQFNGITWKLMRFFFFWSLSRFCVDIHKWS